MVVDGAVPADLNIARRLTPGSDALGQDEAYAMLVADGLAPARVTQADIATPWPRMSIRARSAGFPWPGLAPTRRARRPMTALARAGRVPARQTDADVAEILARYTFLDVYAEPSPQVTAAATKALDDIGRAVGVEPDAGPDA